LPKTNIFGFKNIKKTIVLFVIIPKISFSKQ